MAVCASFAAAWAQSPPQPEPPRPTVIRLDDIVIAAPRPRPSVFYVLSRARTFAGLPPRGAGEDVSALQTAVRAREALVRWREVWGALGQMARAHAARARAAPPEQRAALRREHRRLWIEMDARVEAAAKAATAHLEVALKESADDPWLTPRIISALVELATEASERELGRRMDEYDRALEQLESGQRTEEPPLPRGDFSRAIALSSDLLRRFPRYEHSDVALYLRGWALQQMDRDEEAAADWRALGERHPASALASEAWLRVGEHHFRAGEWGLATTALGVVVGDAASPFWDKASYVLGWAHYQARQYDRAIRAFLRLVDAADRAAQPGGQASRGELLPECVEVLARLFADDDWDGDGQPDRGAGTQRALSHLDLTRPGHRQVAEAYAAALFDLRLPGGLVDAARVYDAVLTADPLSDRCPARHTGKLRALELVRDRDGLIEALGEVASFYAADSAWSREHAGSPQVMAEARALVERSLRRRALHLHQSAQRVRAERGGRADGAAAARRLYLDAARTYEAYLLRFADSGDGAKLRFYRADALFSAREFERAATAFASVRDREPRSEHREEAAFTAMLATRLLVEERVRQGTLPGPSPIADALTVATFRPGEALLAGAPLPLPAEVRRWSEHAERYLELGLEHPGNAAFPAELRARVAHVLLRYRQHQRARAHLDALSTALQAPLAQWAREVLEAYGPPTRPR